MIQETVAIVVVTYNRADLLERMLAGLAELERLPDAVIVVDNASTDHTPEVLEAAQRTGRLGALEVIRTTENLGERAASTTACARPTPGGSTGSG